MNMNADQTESRAAEGDVDVDGSIKGEMAPPLPPPLSSLSVFFEVKAATVPP